MRHEIVPGYFPRNHVVEFGGLPVAVFAPGDHEYEGSHHEEVHEFVVRWLEDRGLPVPRHLLPEGAAALRAAGLADPGSVAWWVAVSEVDDIPAWLEYFTETVDTTAVTALVVGGAVEGDEAEDIVLALIHHSERFPELRSLFVGEIDDGRTTTHEAEIAPLFAALPGLTDLRCCVSDDLEFGRVEHAALRRLVIHSTALSPRVVEDVAASDLPALEHLEMWSGERFADAQHEWEAEAFERLAHSTTLPALRHLGLRDFTFMDEIVALLARGPLVRGLDSLDLSRSFLTDTGARLLLGDPAFHGLRRLDLRRPDRARALLSSDTASRLVAGLAAVDTDVLL
ncbi:hypothetical protein [Nocardiopsis sp. FIRDI 009]|uniref:hypothetical protein n=1 Tax=Nocardiopsis sp. FIRDI 009 TaxID=714197 RepID=UPI000E250BDC|nr:hypothetical protein [Nocardiopsis sp. FIRDI 009]